MMTKEEWNKYKDLEYYPNRFCACGCGGRIRVQSHHKYSGIPEYIKGHSKRNKPDKDITGQRFNMLVAVRTVGKGKDGTYIWLCNCDCGNDVEVHGSALRRGTKRSCGCLQTFSKGEAMFNTLYRSYRKRCVVRKLEFNLTRDQFRKITKGSCYYCGVEPKQVLRGKTNNGSYVYNGIDRKDSSKGYTLNNSVSCCGRCNVAKGSRSVKEFYVWLEQLYKHCIVERKNENTVP